MPRPALVPLELTKGPFTLEEARRAGLARWRLETSVFVRVGPKLYAWSGLGADPSIKLAAALLRLPPTAVFSGATAAWLHGLEIDPCGPIDATIPIGVGISARAGINLRRARLAASDVTSKRRFRVTTIERTLADLCLDMELSEVVVLSDTATHRGIATVASLNAAADRYAGRAGIAKFRRAIHLTEPKTESPMETRTRMVLVNAGLPRPSVQVELHDRHGEFLARVDLYFPEGRLAIEYDGGVHKSSVAEDNRRQNRLLAEGIQILRFTASDVYNRPQVIVEQVRAMLNRKLA